MAVGERAQWDLAARTVEATPLTTLGEGATHGQAVGRWRKARDGVDRLTGVAEAVGDFVARRKAEMPDAAA